MLPCIAVSSYADDVPISALNESRSFLCSRKTSSWTILWKIEIPPRRTADNAAVGRTILETSPYDSLKVFKSYFWYMQCYIKGPTILQYLRVLLTSTLTRLKIPENISNCRSIVSPSLFHFSCLWWIFEFEPARSASYSEESSSFPSESSVDSSWSL